MDSFYIFLLFSKTTTVHQTHQTKSINHGYSLIKYLYL